MPSLCVEYLHGRAGHAEWPASPDRLLQAMVATAYAAGLDGQALQGNRMKELLDFA